VIRVGLQPTSEKRLKCLKCSTWCQGEGVSKGVIEGVGWATRQGVDAVRETSGCFEIGPGRDPHSHGEPDELPRVGGDVREDDIERVAEQHD
jgi:hypothetical protein